jgi:ribokinase
MSTPDRVRICVVGSINVDFFVRAPRLPAPGETVLGGTAATCAGGKGANQAVAAARMGAEVSFVGAVGDDGHGHELIRLLQSEGIDASRLAVREGVATGTGHVTVDERTGENTIIVASGANATVSAAGVEAAAAVIAQADLLVLQLEIPMPAITRAMEIAGDAGTAVLLNAAPAQRLGASVLGGVEVLVVNEIEGRTIASGTPALGMAAGPDAEPLPGPDAETFAAVAGLGRGIAVMTLGQSGAYWSLQREGRGHLPACDVRAIDTVGAGDAFCGTLAVRLAEHRVHSRGGALGRMDVFDAVCWANAAGALATLKPGAIPSLPARRDIAAMLRASYREGDPQSASGSHPNA